MTLPEKRENPDKDHNKPVAEQTIEQQLQDAREQVLKMFSAKKQKDDPQRPGETAAGQITDN